MKKIISLVLCLVLGSFVLSGCSGSDEPFEEKKKATQQIHKSMRSILMYRTEELKCRYLRTNKSIFNIRKTA